MGEAERAKDLLLLLRMRLGLFEHTSAVAKKHKAPSSRDGLKVRPETLHACAHVHMCTHSTHPVRSGQSPSGSMLRYVSISHIDCSSQQQTLQSSVPSRLLCHSVLGVAATYQVETAGFPETLASSSLGPSTKYLFCPQSCGASRGIPVSTQQGTETWTAG